MARAAYVNGRYVPFLQARVSVEDRGYQFADGVYEVCPVQSGQIKDADEHLARLARSLKALDVPQPMSRRALKIVMNEVRRRNRVQKGVIYIQVTRGAAPRAHAPPNRKLTPSLVVTARADLKRSPSAKIITLPDVRWGRCDVKSIALLPNILAARQAAQAGADEAWFINDQGFVTEGAASNAWIVLKDGRLLTHPANQAILAGITRRKTLNAARALRLPIEERAFTLRQASNAAEAFFTASTAGITPVIKINDAVVGQGRAGPCNAPPNAAPCREKLLNPKFKKSVFLIHPRLSADRRRDVMRTPEAELQEAEDLVAALSLTLVDSLIVPVARPRRGWLFGQGAVERVENLLRRKNVSLAVVNAALTPVQQRSLEKKWQVKVLDRTGLILEIFAARAQTREASLQVETARLSWQKTRLVRSWTHLERQRGGRGFLAGPGERQIEADRRQIAEKIIVLQKQLRAVRSRRALQRKARRALPAAALVGYTNAGKSTLFNRLAAADQPAQNLLFHTLDPSVRNVPLPGNAHAVLSDTVGFISQLPTLLVNAFHATLEEVRRADVIIHVRDASHPDSSSQKQDVLNVLAQLKLENKPVIEVLNKIDRIPLDARDRLKRRAAGNTNLALLSARTGEGVQNLLTLLRQKLIEPHMTKIRITLGPADASAAAFLHSKAQIISKAITPNGHTRLHVAFSPVALGQFRKQFPLLTQKRPKTS